jgi:hypothetical protein
MIRCRRPKGPTAKRRASKARRLKRDENLHKAEARARDGAGGLERTGLCRFPICGCHFEGGAERPGSKAFVEVSHQRHKGMGGDPTGERSLPAGLICVCNWRHKESTYSIDKGTVRWVALTSAGANGPVAWEVEIDSGRWLEVARESAVQVLEPITLAGQYVLKMLAEMRT